MVDPTDDEKKFYTTSDVARGKILKPKTLEEKIPLDSKYMIDGKYPFIYSAHGREGEIPDNKTGKPTTNFYRCYFSCISFPMFKDVEFLKKNEVLITKLIHGHSHSVKAKYIQLFGKNVQELKQNVFRYVHHFFKGEKPPYIQPGKLGYRSYVFLFAVNNKEEQPTVTECVGEVEYKDYAGSEQGSNPQVAKIIGRTWGELAYNVKKCTQYTIDEHCKGILSEEDFEKAMKIQKAFEEKYELDN